MAAPQTAIPLHDPVRPSSSGRSLVAAALCALVLAACGQGAGEHRATGFETGEAWLRLPTPGRDVAAGYLSVTNNSGQPQELHAITSPQVRAIELHEHVHSEGMMQMRRVASYRIEPGATLQMQPGGYHLMLFGVPDGLAEGDTLPVELVFRSGDNASTIQVPLVAHKSR